VGRHHQAVARPHLGGQGPAVPGQYLFLVDRHPDPARVLETDVVRDRLDLDAGVGYAHRSDGSPVCWRIGPPELEERAA